MDNIRLLLFMALAFISLLLWEAWQADYVLPKQQSTPVAQMNNAADVPVANTNDAPSLPQASMPTMGNLDPSTAPKLVHVVTDTLDVYISSVGGSIIDAKLNKYPVSVDQPDIKYHLMSERMSDYFIAQSGLLGADAERTPNHTSTFAASQASYRMADDANDLVVDLQWASKDGLVVTKRYTFTRGNMR